MLNSPNQGYMLADPRLDGTPLVQIDAWDRVLYLGKRWDYEETDAECKATAEQRLELDNAVSDDKQGVLYFPWSAVSPPPSLRGEFDVINSSTPARIPEFIKVMTKKEAMEALLGGKLRNNDNPLPFSPIASSSECYDARVLLSSEHAVCVMRSLRGKAAGPWIEPYNLEGTYPDPAIVMRILISGTDYQPTPDPVGVKMHIARRMSNNEFTNEVVAQFKSDKPLLNPHLPQPFTSTKKSYDLFDNDMIVFRGTSKFELLYMIEITKPDIQVHVLELRLFAKQKADLRRGLREAQKSAPQKSTPRGTLGATIRNKR